MTSEQLEPLKKWTRKRLRSILCTLLYLKNLCRGNKLKVIDTSLNEIVVLRGNTIDIFWRVTGCHKIVVEHFGILSGKTKGITVPYDKCAPSFCVVFYGVRAKVIKVISLPESCSVEMTNAFESALSPVLKKDLCLTPNLKSLRLTEKIISHAPFQGVQLNFLMPKPILVKENFSVSHELPNLKILLPEYRQEDYPKL